MKIKLAHKGMRCCIILFCTVMLASGWGCLRSPETSFYLLTPQTGAVRSGSARGEITIGVAQIVVPKYLERTQIVTLSPPNQLKLDEFHRWGEPLRDNLTRVFIIDLSARLPGTKILPYPQMRTHQTSVLLEIQILRFLGVLNKGVELDAVWRLSDAHSHETRVMHSTHIEQKTGSDDVESLVIAKSKALGRFADEIAVAISGL